MECPSSPVTQNYSSFSYPGEPTAFKELNAGDYVKIVFCVSIMAGTFVGNIGVIITVAFNRSMRSTINIYVANLAVADMLICAFCMTVQFVNTLTGSVYILGPVMCKINGFSQMTCVTASVLTLSAIACDRFTAILFPLHVRITKQRTGLVISAIWLISVAVSIPLLVVRTHVVLIFKDFTQPSCVEIWPQVYDPIRKKCDKTSENFYYTFVSVTLFFLPVVIMTSAYSLILWRLSVTEVPGEHHAANVNVQHRARKKVVKMVFVVLIVFVICWMPLQIVILYAKHRDKEVTGHALPDWFGDYMYFAEFIAYSNSFWNPIIYGGFNKTFREGFCLFLRCGNRPRRFGRPQASQRSRLTFTTGVTASPSNYLSRMVNGSAGHGYKPPSGALEMKAVSNSTTKMAIRTSPKETCTFYGEDTGKISTTYT